MSLLNEDQILERLTKPDPDFEIFRPGTWRRSQLRPAGYDLRVDSSVRAKNDDLYEDGQYEGEFLYLDPGDSAFVLSVERFVMPWDLAANLGLRFRFARQGLSVLTGLLVDPGYGLRRNGTDWAKDGAALHFFLVNIGAETISIRLGEEGDGVLSLQFLETNPAEKHQEVGEPDNVAPATALGVYREVAVLEKEMRKQRKKQKERQAEMEAEIGNLRAMLETTRSATENIVVFGVFLIAVTLIGVTATILIETLAGKNIATIIDTLNRLHLEGFSETIVTLAALAVIAAFIFALVGAFTWIYASGIRVMRDRSR